MMIRRSFLPYLSSQGSYFFSPYYVHLILNMGLWVIACICAYRYARLVWSNSVAPYFTFLVATAPGFIMYVAQPMSYLAGYAVIIILLYLFEYLIVRNTDLKMGAFALFGSCLGLGMLVYDIFPLLVIFFVYAYSRKISSRGVLLILLIALGVYSGFLILQAYGLNMLLSPSNGQFLALGFVGVYELIARLEIGEIYSLSASFLRLFMGSLGNAFLVLPVALAFIGAALIREKSRLWLVLLLAIPALLPLIILHYGQVYWNDYALASFPRFAFVAYPLVYLLASDFLVEVRNSLARKGRSTLGLVIPWSLLGLVFLLNNVDAFGYPELYILFYFAEI
jgi:hypothetical protein